MKKIIALLLFIPLTITAAPTNTQITEFFWSAPTVNIDQTPLTDLAGFKVYCRTETTNYPPQGFDVPDPNARTLAIDAVVDMLIEEKYYCTVTAYDRDGNEGPYGPETNFLVMAGTAHLSVTVPAAVPVFGVR